MSADDEIRLLGELASLLERQIELARRGGLAGLEQLAGQCEPLVAKITAAGLLEKPEFKEQQLRLEGLYRNLYLIVTTQKVAAEDELKRVHRGRRIVGNYRRNLASL
jgi:hypothetical protein